MLLRVLEQSLGEDFRIFHLQTTQKTGRSQSLVCQKRGEAIELCTSPAIQVGSPQSVKDSLNKADEERLIDLFRDWRNASTACLQIVPLLGKPRCVVAKMFRLLGSDNVITD